jgi:hypothetical protein
MSISGLMSDQRVVNNHRLTKSKTPADNHLHEIRSISLWHSSKHDQGHRKDKQAQERTLLVISAVFTVALLLVPFTWVDNAQIHALNYTFTSTSSMETTGGLCRPPSTPRSRRFEMVYQPPTRGDPLRQCAPRRYADVPHGAAGKDVERRYLVVTAIGSDQPVLQQQTP